MTSFENTFTISNDTLTDDLIADGLISKTAVGQSIVVTVGPEGTFLTSGIFDLGFSTSFTIIPNRNILTFSLLPDIVGGITMNRSGELKEKMIANFTYDHIVNGTRYKIDSITLDGSTGQLSIDVDTHNPPDSSGTIQITI